MKQFLIILLVFVLSASVMAGCSRNEISDEPFPSFTEASEEPTYDTQRWESLLTYKEYIKLSDQERAEFIDSFENPDDFYTWYAAVKAAYDKRLEQNQIGLNGSLNMDQIAGKQ